MKLRSGKVLLPPVIEKKLLTDLKEFKELLELNKNFAKDLIKVIAEANNMEVAYRITDIIENTFKNIEPKTGKVELLSICGALLTLITGDNEIYYLNNIEPIFHNVIHKRLLEAYDLEVPLIGMQEDIEI